MEIDYLGRHKLISRKVEIALFQVGETLLEFICPYDRGAPWEYLQEN